MHAYSSVDPVFRAMNQRGLRETGGDLGAGCVSCHAPAALLFGLTENGDNLAELPGPAQGVTCAVCHGVVAMANGAAPPIEVSEDGVMRGPIADPIPTSAHGNQYSELHDRKRYASSNLCGGCHDRSLREWHGSVFGYDDPEQMLTCGACHMDGRDGVASSVAGVPVRRVHSHMNAGVDLAYGDFPDKEAQAAAVAQELASAVLTQMCVVPEGPNTFLSITLENIAAGHNWPSCSRDRRSWVEIVAYGKHDNLVYESGLVANDEPLGNDPDLWVFGDTLRDASGEQVHMYWDAVEVESTFLPPMGLGFESVHVNQSRLLQGVQAERLTLSVKVRPTDRATLDDLVESGDLDPAIRDASPTHTLENSVLEWRSEMGATCLP